MVSFRAGLIARSAMSGPAVALSGSTVAANAAIGATVGVLSTVNTTGSYTYTLTSNPGGLFAISGANLNVAAALSAGTYPVTVQAAGGVPTPISNVFAITVTPVPVAPVNTVAPVIAGTPQEGQTLTVTNNGTWTGFPAPGFTYQWNRNLPVSAEVAQWLARATGLDAAHIAADTALIDGLVADGDWGSFDVIHVYATQDSATALLNLVSSNYNGTANGSPVFTVDRGYVGVESSGSVYINTNFRPDTAVSPKFTQNSGHVSGWVPTDTGTSGSSTIGVVSSGSTSNSAVFPLVAGNTAHFRINSGGFTGTPVPTSAGHSLANRSDASSVQGYKNGVGVFSTGSSASAAVSPHFIVTLGVNNFNTIVGSSHKVAMITIGSSLSAAAALRVYNRFRTRMTAVGVP